MHIQEYCNPAALFNFELFLEVSPTCPAPNFDDVRIRLGQPLPDLDSLMQEKWAGSNVKYTLILKEEVETIYKFDTSQEGSCAQDAPASAFMPVPLVDRPENYVDPLLKAAIVDEYADGYAAGGPPKPTRAFKEVLMFFKEFYSTKSKYFERQKQQQAGKPCPMHAFVVDNTAGDDSATRAKVSRRKRKGAIRYRLLLVLRATYSSRAGRLHHVPTAVRSYRRF